MTSLVRKTIPLSYKPKLRPRPDRAASYEAGALRFATHFTIEQIEVTGPSGRASLKLGPALNLPGLRHEATGDLYGTGLGVLRPKYGFRKVDRRIYVFLGDDHEEVAQVTTESLNAYRIDHVDFVEPLLRVDGTRRELALDAPEQAVALAVLIHESGLPSTGLLRSYLPSSALFVKSGPD